jgi:hypothetical protein
LGPKQYCRDAYRYRVSPETKPLVRFQYTHVNIVHCAPATLVSLAS